MKLARFPFMAAATTAAALFISFSGGCVSLQDLRPAFEVNQVNVAELSRNSDQMAAMLHNAGKVLIESELRARRTKVATQLARLRAEIKKMPDGRQTIDEWMKDSPDALAKEMRLMQSGIAVADAPTRRLKAIDFPVLYAMATLAVSPATVATDADEADRAAKLSTIIGTTTEKYPTVIEAVAQLDKFDKAMTLYKETIAAQGVLAKRHAALFVTAATANANIAAAMASVLSDPLVQEKAFGLVGDERIRDSVREGMDVLEQILGGLKRDAAPTP